MILVDAGPLIAILDGDDKNHGRCAQVVSTLTPPLWTTWPVLTEAMHILGRSVGWVGQKALWDLILPGDVRLVHVEGSLALRARDLMEQYRDTPMDLADASLVALAEARGIHRIFTLDRHFHVYRLHDKQAFEVIP